MKVKAISFEYEPRVSLYLVPETEVERELLRALWKHGALELTNGVADGTGQGFAITTAYSTRATDCNNPPITKGTP